eukprot:CAMPEP_0181176580 /NCGR_PEP_ID=MMETSP1096-20121128/4705_1 /TAXON_ID=156174 ORGANISM="Chrysochromulina ericina, Strain CCMP281" /NCGR_SAMPLE_ID=MMETSP1096 /ASSEMBLY_ACC=CAM_ASM_000453 /LENGTH=88 /DNA_ID=CAMNT_0023264677 /DNA_START=444 /DNA_END=711 /DNA_ORIENTATION=+
MRRPMLQRLVAALDWQTQIAPPPLLMLQHSLPWRKKGSQPPTAAHLADGGQEKCQYTFQSGVGSVQAWTGQCARALDRHPVRQQAWER